MYEAGFKGFNLYDRLTEENIECVVLPPHLYSRRETFEGKNG